MEYPVSGHREHERNQQRPETTELRSHDDDKPRPDGAYPCRKAEGRRHELHLEAGFLSQPDDVGAKRHVPGLEQEQREQRRRQRQPANGYTHRRRIAVAVNLAMIVGKERHHQQRDKAEGGEREEKHLRPVGRHEARQIHDTDAPEAELHDQQHAKHLVGALCAGDHRERCADKCSTNEAVAKPDGNEKLCRLQLRRNHVNQDEHDQRPDGEPSPVDALDDEDRDEGSRRSAIDIGGPHNPRL